MSTPAVSRAFNRQLDNLNELLVMCEHGRSAMDEALSKGQRIKPFVRAANEEIADKVIPLYTHAAIYSEERQTTQSVLGENEEPEKPVEASRTRMTIEEARSRVQYPINMNTLYHPDCLVDHHDSRFDSHTGVYLYQKDIRDIRGQLVEPWRMQSVYKPGTLLLAVCTFKMWGQGTEGSSETQHFYNIQLRQVKVIAESPEEQEVPGMVPPIQTTSRSDPFQSIPEFESFSAAEEPPAKRPRLASSSK